MLCCVSRKASTRSNFQNNENNENQIRSILNSDRNFSAVKSSVLINNEKRPSDIFPIVRTSKISCTEIFSVPPEFSHEGSFLTNNSNVIHTPEKHSVRFSGEPKRQFKTFSAPARQENVTEKSNFDPKLNQHSSIKDEPKELLPCAICARTFKPESLEKHTKICETSALKKRKPFDSAKQRIQGTELAEFLPKETPKKRHSDVTANRASWKQTHDEFLRTIRAARGVTMETNRDRKLMPPSNVILGAPTRPNEKGMCPTCNRQFSIKSYERHVAWCKERATRVPVSAATNIAKERLEARMKYRAPALKNRRAANREKYSPVSNLNLVNLANKNNNNSSINNGTANRGKEKASTPNRPGNENSTGSQSQKSTNARRSSQSREGVSSGPMKSRLSDRSNRLSDETDPGVASSPKQARSPLCPSSPRKNVQIANKSRIPRKSPPRMAARQESENNCETTAESKKPNEPRNRRHRLNFVQARSRGNPRINDVAVNDEVVGMVVEACDQRRATCGDDDGEFVTWKKIGEKRASAREFLKLNSVEKIEKLSTELEDEKKSASRPDKSELENIPWMNSIRKLDQTYLIRDSGDGENELVDLFGKKTRRPVIDSPRIEFYYDKKSREKLFFGSQDEDGHSVRSSGQKSVPTLSRVEALNFEENNVIPKSSRSKKNSENSGRSARRSESAESKKISDPERYGLSRASVTSKSSNLTYEKSAKTVSETTIAEREFSSDSFDVQSRVFDDKTPARARSSEIDARTSEETSPKREFSKKSCDDLVAEKIAKMQSLVENLYLESSGEKKSEKLQSENDPDGLDSKSDKSDSKSEGNEERKCVDRSPKTEISSVTLNEEPERLEDKETAAESQNDEKVDYRRSGTYVIEDKKLKCSFDSKHRIPDEMCSQTPSKRRRTEKKSSSESEDEKTEDSQSDESTMKKNDQVREKYVNRTFDYDSDGTVTTENFFEDFEADNEEKSKKRSSPVIPILENCQKSCSDSQVRFRSSATLSSGIAFPPLAPEATSSAIEFKDGRVFSEPAPEVVNSCETGSRSRERLATVPEKPEVQNSIRMRRKLREKMNQLRGKTNNLINSIEACNNNGSYENSIAAGSFEADSIREIEEETIHELDLGNAGKVSLDAKTSCCGFLPEIPIDRIIGKNERGDKRLAARETSPFSWQRANKNARLINLDPPGFHKDPTPRRIFNVANLPPVVSLGKKKRSGSCLADYDPFLIAERQMNELLSESEKSLTDSSSIANRRSSSPVLPSYPLAHSSAFVKYSETTLGKLSEKRVSVIEPPTEFDDFSSDSTETNSIIREITSVKDPSARSREHVLGRRVIIDKSRALMGNHNDSSSISSLFDNSPSYNGKVRKFFERTSPKVARSNSVRVGQSNENKRPVGVSATKNSQNSRKNNLTRLTGSNVSLSSIVSTDVDNERSIFDEQPSSCDDDVVSTIYPSLRSLLKNDSLSVTSPVQSNRSRNGLVSDDEFSSPDSYKRQQEQNKLSADSAYSSLNRKYSNHGRSANDVAGVRQDEDSPLHLRDLDNVTSNGRSKMSKFCHECGSKFPDTAKFCCECGIRRLAL